jgi:G6PDH family F420-dependent oxidoreductase
VATIGYFLSSEDRNPREIVEGARMAEAAGFPALWLSDHFHPWLDEQGESPFVWSLIGAIASATNDVRLTTAVTCPLIRIHPAIIAQAAATSALLLDGRFALGVGTGEALNEHILGDHWPTPEIRLAMLEEAIGLMRELWKGGSTDHHGAHYTVENARLYSLPETPPQILVSGFGPKAIELAAKVGDGYMNVTPSPDNVEQYRSAGGKGVVQGGLKVCYDTDKDQARRTYHHFWRNELVPGQLAQDLPTPTHFEQASTLVTEDMVGESKPLGPDPQVHIDAIQEYVDAGFDEVYVAQVGPDQRGFLDFYAKEVLPHFAGR